MSIKLKIGWADNNVIIEGVRIYKSSTLFDTNSLPAIYAEITDGSLSYEDFEVIEGNTYFYMLSCFMGEQEVFTECFEVVAEPPSPYNGVYLIGSSTDAVILSAVSDILSTLDVEIYIKTWAQIDDIPATAKIIIAPHFDYTKADTSTGATKLVAKFNTGIPVLISTYSNTTPTMPNLGIGANFSDSSGSSVDIAANTILSPPFNTAQSGLVIRESSYYMSGLNSPASNAQRFAQRSSHVVGAILLAGVINRNNVPSPANVAFAGFIFTDSTRKLNETGKNLFREIVNKTMR